MSLAPRRRRFTSARSRLSVRAASPFGVQLRERRIQRREGGRFEGRGGRRTERPAPVPRVPLRGDHLRQCATHMEGSGHRIQYSVFRCWMTARAVERFRWALTDLRDPADAVRLLPLGTRCVDAERPAARVFGRRSTPSSEGVWSCKTHQNHRFLWKTQARRSRSVARHPVSALRGPRSRLCAPSSEKGLTRLAFAPYGASSSPDMETLRTGGWRA